MEELNFAFATDGMDTADAVGMGGPKHAHLWLTSLQRDAWISGNKIAPIVAFSCVMGYWVLHIFSKRILNRQKVVKGERAIAELQHAAVSLLHAMLSVAGGLYLLVYRDMRAGCGERLFCFDEQSGLLMDLHVGFLLYELMYYHSHARLHVRPQFGMTLLHHLLLIMAYVLTKMYPCRLTIELLPYYELCGVAEIFNSLRMVLNQYGAPAHFHFNNLLAMMAAFVARVLTAALLAWMSYSWVRNNDLWHLELPEGQSILSIPYGVLFIAGPVLLLMIYMKWFVEGTDIVNNLVAAIERQQARREAAEKKEGGAQKGGKGEGRKQR